MVHSLGIGRKLSPPSSWLSSPLSFIIRIRRYAFHIITIITSNSWRKVVVFFLSFIQKIAFISAGNGSMYFEPIRLVWFFYFLLTLFAQLHSICFCEFECDVIMTVAQVYLHQNHQILSSKNIPHLHLVLQQHHSTTRITQTRRKKKKTNTQATASSTVATTLFKMAIVLIFFYCRLLVGAFFLCTSSSWCSSILSSLKPTHCNWAWLNALI